jgi:hypothetical protein
MCPTLSAMDLIVSGRPKALGFDKLFEEMNAILNVARSLNEPQPVDGSHSLATDNLCHMSLNAVDSGWKSSTPRYQNYVSELLRRGMTVATCHEKLELTP